MDPEEMFERILLETKKNSQPAQDPLVFIVRGDEVRDLLIKNAERYEKMAAEEDTGVASLEKAKLRPIRPMPIPRPSGAITPGVALPVGMGEYTPPPMAPVYREWAWSCRWLADHVETDRVFRLGMHDLALIGVSVRSGGYC
jgi:hypothetical protein